MKTYMISLLGTQTNWNSFSDERRKDILKEFGAWVEDLRKRDLFVYGASLGVDARTIRRVDQDLVVDGPFPETKELLTGFFMVKAPDMEGALAIARECPGLKMGETVQVMDA